ncbi:FeoA family protein [Aminivibrio sp.]|uniref:FeoA family protein n=1 Tax=Aminivibrio sp. TaxID=1872489 RepID=UPI001A55DFF7|nr:FeoA family protein [Aminivibrio sp.]MBL3540249.1 ferrous iron transport protein A [Aminivibrio sp.]
MCPITIMPEGSEVTVARVAGGGEASKRLSELGLVPGVQVSVVRNGGGPLLLKVGDSRFALGQGMALKVFVDGACR